MPRMSEAELREWYERFSKEVWLKAQIDVSSKEDLGRVRNAEIKNWEADDLIYAQVDFTFAYMPQGEDGYLNPAPDTADFAEYSKWMMDNLNPKMNIKRIQALYDQSRNGTLMIAAPGGSIYNLAQVYTDEMGEIHTSLPRDQYDILKAEDIPEGQEILYPPENVPDPDPKDYYSNYPKKPEPPENMDPGFWSWVGYLIGIDTDYAKMVRYEKAMEDYPKEVENWTFHAKKDPAETAEYQRAQRERMDYLTEATEYQENYKAKFFIANKAFRDGISFIEDPRAYVQRLLDEKNFLVQQHEVAQNNLKKELGSEMDGAKEMMRYPKRTEDVLRNLVGHAPQPDTLKEWINRQTLKPGDYKPEPYELPKSAGYDNMSPEEKAADQQKWAALAEIAGFAAVVDPEIMGQQVRPGFTLEENAALRYGMIINDLFTKGRPQGKQHIDVLEPARKIAKEALDAYAANNPEPLAKLLVRSIQMTNREARSLTTSGTDSEHAIDTVYLISRLYNTLNGILGGDPKRMEEVGLNQQDLDETLGNVAFYEMLNRNYEAKQKLVEYAIGERDLSEEELLEIGKDMLLSAVVSSEHSLFYSQESERIQASPEQAANLERLAAVNEYGQLLLDMPRIEAKGETERLQKLKERQTELQGKYGFGSGQYTLEEEKRIATGKITLVDNTRSPYPINQDLRNPKWVETFKNQLAEKADLRNLMACPRDYVGKILGMKQSVVELADKALSKLVKEEQKKEQHQPKKEVQLEQSQQKEVQFQFGGL